MAITERTYKAIVNRMNKYIEATIPHLQGDEIGWYGDVDRLEDDGKYEWRAYDPDTDTTYRLICDWNKKKVNHFTISGDAYKNIG